MKAKPKVKKRDLAMERMIQDESDHHSRYDEQTTNRPKPDSPKQRPAGSRRI